MYGKKVNGICWIISYWVQECFTQFLSYLFYVEYIYITKMIVCIMILDGTLRVVCYYHSTRIGFFFQRSWSCNACAELRILNQRPDTKPFIRSECFLSLSALLYTLFLLRWCHARFIISQVQYKLCIFSPFSSRNSTHLFQQGKRLGI